MFIGHLGFAYFLKKYDKSLNLGFLFIAVELMDIALMFFLLLGMEHVRFTPGITAYTSLDLYDFPYSHSLLASILWALGTYLAARYIFLRKSDKSETEKFRASFILAIAVLSHFVLDYLVHIPDLLLIPGIDYKVGLGLWNYVIISVALELSILLIGSVFYFKAKNPDSGPIAKYGMLLLIIFQIFLAIISPFMPDAPNVIVYVFSTLFSITLLTLIAFWLDRERNLSNTNNS